MEVVATTVAIVTAVDDDDAVVNADDKPICELQLLLMALLLLLLDVAIRSECEKFSFLSSHLYFYFDWFCLLTELFM